MADTNVIVDVEGLSHFKAKQDIENAKKFKSKDEATDLKGAVRYDAAQVLTDEQKAQARANIGAAALGEGGGTAEGAVLYNAEQALTDEQKAQARENIGTTDGTWANMPDKPFYETGVKIEWDGTPTDNFIDDLKDTLGIMFYKVGEPITKENLIGSTVTFMGDGRLITTVITADMLIDLNEDCFLVMYNNEVPMFSVSLNATVADLSVIDPDLGTFETDTAGVWFLSAVDGSVRTLFLVTADYDIKKIDKKYIPDDIVAGCHITPFAMLIPKDGKMYLYKLSDKLISGEATPEDVCLKITTDNFLIPFMLFTSIPADTTKDFVISIVTEMDMETGVRSTIEVNLGKITQKLLSDNYLITVQKRSDGSYTGAFLHNPSAIAPLDSSGLIPSQYLPSFVDDVVEGSLNAEGQFIGGAGLITPESGKIYVDLNTGNTYRWSGSVYVQLNPKEYTIATNADIDALFT